MSSHLAPAHGDLRTGFPFPFVVLAGGVVDERRRVEARRGELPSSDVLELEQMPGARLLDFGWLEREKERAPGVRLLSRLLGPSWALAWCVLREIERPCALYTTGEDLGIPLAVLLRLFGREQVFVATRFENPEVGRTRLRRLAFRSLLRFALGRMDLVLCRSRRHMGHLAETYGYERTVLGREVNDVTFYDPDRAESQERTAPLGLTDSSGSATENDDGFAWPAGPFLVSAGLELRDYGTLLEAVRDLPIHVVIGAGSPWSHFAFDPAGSIPENVTVGRFSPVRMRQLYAAAELVVVPLRPTSRTCGISVVLEAFAMRKAVIVTRTGGLVDYVKHGEDVLEVHPGDPVDLRAAIRELLGDVELRRSLSQRGYERVRRELSLLEYPSLVAREVRARAGARLGSSPVLLESIPGSFSFSANPYSPPDGSPGSRDRHWQWTRWGGGRAVPGSGGGGDSGAGDGLVDRSARVHGTPQGHHAGPSQTSAAATKRSDSRR